MLNKRSTILSWAETGRLAPANVEQAIESTNASPSASSWIEFLRVSLLWLAISSISLGFIFFFAYNWQEMSRLTKFSLIETAMIVSAVAYVRLSINHSIAKITLMGMSLLTGGLLALVGQTYQTGADPWQLFAVWSLLSLPWTVVSRSNILWAFWLILINLTLVLFMDANYGIFGLRFNDQAQLWIFSIFNSLLLIGFELAHRFSASKQDQSDLSSEYTLNFSLQHRYVHQFLVFACGFAVTFTAFDALFSYSSQWFGLVFYVVWISAVFFYYYRVQKDLFVISSCLFSLIAFIAALLFEWFDGFRNSGGFLLISFVVVGLSTVAGLWLKKLANNEQWQSPQIADAVTQEQTHES